MQPTLAIIDVDIQSGQDEAAREALLTNLRGHCKACVQPLWVNLMRERADLRVVCLVRDLARLDDFLVDTIRATPGVRGTSARLAFGGVVRADVITELPLQDSAFTRRAAAAVFVKTEPGRDRQTYEALIALPPHPEVKVAWALKVFHSPEADIKLLLLGERTTALTGYVMSWVRTVPGVLDTELTAVLDWEILGKPEDFIELAECFPDPKAK
jgi:hypothetical protein